MVFSHEKRAIWNSMHCWCSIYIVSILNHVIEVKLTDLFTQFLFCFEGCVTDNHSEDQCSLSDILKNNDLLTWHRPNIQENLLAVLGPYINPCSGPGFTFTVEFSQTSCLDLNMPTSLVKINKFTCWFTKVVYYHLFLTRNQTSNGD